MPGRRPGTSGRVRGADEVERSGGTTGRGGEGPLPDGLRRGGRTLTPGGEPWTPRRSTAVFLDVDGTTVGAAPVASPAVAAAHARALAAGLRVVFATGRLPRGLHELQQQLADDSPAVVHNGAAVVQGGRELRSWPLPREAAQAFARWCLREQHYVECYADGRMYVSDLREEVKATWDEISGPPDGLLTDLLASDAEVTKATVDVFDVERLPELLATVRALGLTAERSSAPVLPGVPIVNVTAAGVTKGAAVTWLADHLGVDLDSTLVVGDGHNDVSMFGVAGTAVAMGQAPDEVQAAAHLVAPGVDEDGLARVLELAALGQL